LPDPPHSNAPNPILDKLGTADKPPRSTAGRSGKNVAVQPDRNRTPDKPDTEPSIPPLPENLETLPDDQFKAIYNAVMKEKMRRWRAKDKTAVITKDPPL